MAFAKHLFTMLVRKPADQTVNGTTLTDDTDFQFTLESGKKYKVEATLFITMDGVDGISVLLNLTGTATMTNMRLAFTSGRSSTGIYNGTTVTALDQNFQANSNITNLSEASLNGTLECNVGGTFKLQFAEVAILGTGCAIKQDSFFELLEV